MNKRLPFLFLGAYVALSSSCTKLQDDNAAPSGPKAGEHSFNNLIADVANKGEYTFFNLEKGDTVPRSDSATLNWDIAFQSTNIIINGGSSGPGQGAAQLLVMPYKDIYTLPDSGFKADDTTYKAIPPGSGNGWYTYEDKKHFILPRAGVTLAIRTATGKYAKLQILNYYKDAPDVITPEMPNSRYYKFKYFYQPDGSKKVN